MRGHRCYTGPGTGPAGAARVSIACAIACALASCSAPPARSSRSPDPGAERAREGRSEASFDPSLEETPAPAPWTTAFEGRSILLADQVTVEGPQGLIEHLYCDASAMHAKSERTLPEGYEQVVVAQPGSGERIRAQLDGLRIEAVRRLVVLERVTPCDVRVRAAGQVWWSDVDGKQERGETWERTGAIER